MKIMVVTDGTDTKLLKITKEEMAVINKFIELWFIEDVLKTVKINIDFIDTIDIENF